MLVDKASIWNRKYQSALQKNGITDIFLKKCWQGTFISKMSLEAASAQMGAAQIRNICLSQKNRGYSIYGVQVWTGVRSLNNWTSILTLNMTDRNEEGW